MQEITCYKTNDGKIFEDEFKAIEYVEIEFYDKFVKKEFELVTTSVNVMEFIIKYESEINKFYKNRAINRIEE